MSVGNWIAGATKNKGGLHRSLGIKAGTKIPKAKIEAAASRGGKVGKQARLAETLEGLKHKGGSAMAEKKEEKKPAHKRHHKGKAHHKKMMDHHKKMMEHHKGLMKEAEKGDMEPTPKGRKTMEKKAFPGKEARGRVMGDGGEGLRRMREGF